MVRCKSGLHEWFFKDDAEKCCNGYRRELVIGSSGIIPDGYDRIVMESLPDGVRYGYRWVKI